MEKFNLMVDAMDNGPFEKMDAFVHEDFMFFKEYTVQNREEQLEDIKELIEGDWKFNQPQLLIENEDMVALNHIVVEGNSSYRVTAVHFLKDGQTWRLATHRTCIQSSAITTCKTS